MSLRLSAFCVVRGQLSGRGADIWVEVGQRRGRMAHDPANTATHASRSDTRLRTLMGGVSVFTMVMTIPQVLAIWVGQQAAGVSILTWSTYLLSAMLWFWFGILRRDMNIYLPCVGWMVLDGAVIAGAVVYG